MPRELMLCRCAYCFHQVDVDVEVEYNTILGKYSVVDSTSTYTCQVCGRKTVRVFCPDNIFYFVKGSHARIRDLEEKINTLTSEQN